MKIKFSCFLIGMLASFALQAQQAVLQGRVVDQDGEPLDGANVIVGNFYTLTNADGTYRLEIPSGDRLRVYFTNYGYEPDTVVFSVAADTSKTINAQLKLIPNYLEDVDVVDKKARFENRVGIDKKSLDAYVGPGSKVEGIIKTLPGVSSYNELSSQYSVRGGNFDENLVYVNGIQVYRPFLVRNGQQEGLSFINSSMVSNVHFSAGGFEARYGDKMSSVLDITYKKPSEFGINFTGSLMGGNLVFEDRSKNNRFSSLIGARYRTNQLLLNTLDTDADFRPQFTDIQTYFTYKISDEWEASFLGNYSRNLYEVIPSTRTTNFGTFQEALQLTVFFDGKEDYDFTTRFGAINLSHRPNDKLKLNFTSSVYQTTEQEFFDVIGAYRLGDLNNNLGSDDFGEITFTRSTGGFQNYARNELDAIVGNISHRGIYDDGEVTWRWGAKLQYEDIIDRYKEWERLDSAGFSKPTKPALNFDSDSTVVTSVDQNGNPLAGEVFVSQPKEDDLELFQSYDSDAAVQSGRITAYLERSQLYELESGDLFFNAGLRTHFWSFNGQNVLSPRTSLSFKPDWDKGDMVFRFATGFYYQPAFYREMRDLDGGINENIKAQRSIHFVLGHDYQLKIWNRPFKMVTELYYKDMAQLIPYDLDNVRIRYRAENSASGFATGLDYRINGEFVKGVESWASLSVMTIQEDIEDDGAGYIPRPTDQRFNFKIFFQDYLPQDPTFKVSLTLVYGTGLPFGPPQSGPEDRNFRLPDYRRVDIGFSKVLKAEGKTYDWKPLNAFKSLTTSLQVFNLLETRNTVSYLWVQDVSTQRQLAVPNFLTGRLLNFKISAKF